MRTRRGQLGYTTMTHLALVLILLAPVAMPAANEPLAERPPASRAGTESNADRPRPTKQGVEAQLDAREAAARAAKLAAAPFASENLPYTVYWPGGASLGEARITANRDSRLWHFALDLDGSLPGVLAITDLFRSSAGGNFCSTRFTKDSVHEYPLSTRTAKETTTYDASSGIATRTTANGGGTSQMAFTGCARDALDYLFFLRNELAHGRMPATQTVFFGAPYQVSVANTGTETPTIAGQSYTADRIHVTFTGPASSKEFDILFARDAVRTPLLVRVPFTLGTFSMELAR